MPRMNDGKSAEFLVAYHLSRFGLTVLLTGRNDKQADLLVLDSRRARPLAIQVKSRGLGKRERYYIIGGNKRKPKLPTESGFFWVFVSLREPLDNSLFYVVPGKTVARTAYQRKPPTSLWRWDANEKWRDAWHLIASPDK